MPSESSVSDFVDLAHTAPFRLGALEIEPALRQVRLAVSQVVIDPRVMQVLVALARRAGEVVSRDDLIAACWGGVIVGDNAIHRAISRLREVAEGFGAAGFRIETVPRVGYRLHAAEPGVGAAQPRPSIGSHRFGRVIARAGLAAGLALCAILGGDSRVRDTAPLRLLLATDGPDVQASAGLRRRLETDLTEALADRPVSIETGDARKGPRRGYVSQVTATAVGPAHRLDIRLSDARTDDLVWTGTLTRSAENLDALPTAAASQLARAFDCLEEALSDREALDAANLRLFVTACQRAGSDPDAFALSLLRKVTDRQPRSGAAMAWRSLVEAKQAEVNFSDPAWPSEIAALRRASAEHLAAARELGARPGLLRLAEAAGLDRSDWRGRLAALEAGLADDPDLPALHRARSLALQQVGRMGDATDAARRAVALAPLDPEARIGLVDALAYEGRTSLARGQLQDALRIWPDLPSVREASERFELRFGDSRAYLRRIDEGGVESISMATQQGQIRSYLTARADPTPRNVDLALATGGGRAGSPWHVQLYGGFGRLDAAYGMLDRPDALLRLQGGTETLFRPYMRRFRQDPRFMFLAARLGLTQYWRTTGHWPDFCEDPGLRYHCRSAAEAADLARAGA